MRKVAVALIVLYVLPLLCACNQPIESSRAIATERPSMIQPTVTPTVMPTIQPTVIPAITPTIAPTPTPSPTPMYIKNTSKLHEGMSAAEVKALLGKPYQIVKHSEDDLIFEYKEGRLHIDMAREDASKEFYVANFEDFSFLDESIGNLHRGMSTKQVLAAYGEPESKSEVFESEVDVNMCQSWNYPSKGIFLDMSWLPNESKESASVSMLEVVSPFKGKTSRGIMIGSSLDELVAKYHDGIYDDIQYESVLVGSVFGGMLFEIKDNKVSSIEIGAFAE